MKDWLIALAVLVMALIAAGLGWQHHNTKLIAKGDKQGYERAWKEMQGRELEAVRRGRAQEAADTKKATKEAEDARQELAATRTALADAERAGSRMRGLIATATKRSRACPAQAPASGGSPPADTTGDLLAEVQRRLEEAENGTIRFADESHLAGRTCERLYDAMTQ